MNGLSLVKSALGKSVLCFLFCSTLFSLSPANANVLETVGEDLASPVTTPAITPFLVGAGLSLSLYALRTEISYPFQDSITRHRPLDRWAKEGDWVGKIYPNAIYAGYGLIAGLAGSERGYLRAEEMVLSTAYAGLTTSLLKLVFQEGRPNNPVDKKSMPSGHATTAFAFAGIVGAEHPWYFAVPAYILATNTAYSRINDNKHYLHDVVAGATIGVSYALGVYYKRSEQGSRVAQRNATPSPIFVLLPSEDLKGGAAGVAGLF